MSLNETRVHAIDSEDNHPLGIGAIIASAGRGEDERGAEDDAPGELCADIRQGEMRIVKSLRRSTEISKTAQLFDRLLIQYGLAGASEHCANLLLRANPLADFLHHLLHFARTLRSDVLRFRAVRERSKS